MEEKMRRAKEEGYLQWTSNFERKSVFWNSEDSFLQVEPYDHKEVLKDKPQSFLNMPPEKLFSAI